LFWAPIEAQSAELRAQSKNNPALSPEPFAQPHRPDYPQIFWFFHLTGININKIPGNSFKYFNRKG